MMKSDTPRHGLVGVNPIPDATCDPSDSPSRKHSRIPLLPSRLMRARDYVAELLVFIIALGYGSVLDRGHVFVSMGYGLDLSPDIALISMIGLAFGLFNPRAVWRLIVLWILAQSLASLTLSSVDVYRSIQNNWVSPWSSGNKTLHFIYVHLYYLAYDVVFFAGCFSASAYLAKSVRNFARIANSRLITSVRDER